MSVTWLSGRLQIATVLVQKVIVARAKQMWATRASARVVPRLSAARGVILPLGSIPQLGRNTDACFYPFPPSCLADSNGQASGD